MPASVIPTELQKLYSSAAEKVTLYNFCSYCEVCLSSVHLTVVV